jgi:hypothetical protein
MTQQLFDDDEFDALFQEGGTAGLLKGKTPTRQSPGLVT